MKETLLVDGSTFSVYKCLWRNFPRKCEDVSKYPIKNSKFKFHKVLQVVDVVECLGWFITGKYNFCKVVKNNV